MSAHTKGPWSVYPETDGTEICAVDMAPGLPIRQIIARPVIGNNWIANARLIAAAPELLEALREMTDAFAKAMKDAGVTSYPEALADVRRARAAIARATGEQP